MFRSGIKCSDCGDDILITCNDDIEFIKKVDDKPVCDDCYYDKLGALIEECPIGIFKKGDNMLREEIANNLEVIVKDAERLGVDKVNDKHWCYRDFIYVKQAMQYLKIAQYNTTLTAKADFLAIVVMLGTLISSVNMTDEQKDLSSRILALLDEYQTNHLIAKR